MMKTTPTSSAGREAPSAPAEYRRLRRACFAVVFGSVGLAILFGPWQSERETDPLTGRQRRTFRWLGVTVLQQTQTNEVSKWVDANGVRDIQPGRCGWVLSGGAAGLGILPGATRCGGGELPRAFYHRRRGAEDQQAGELRVYQREYLAAHGVSTDEAKHVYVSWLQKARGTVE